MAKTASDNSCSLILAAEMSPCMLGGNLLMLARRRIPSLVVAANARESLVYSCCMHNHTHTIDIHYETPAHALNETSRHTCSLNTVPNPSSTMSLEAVRKSSLSVGSSSINGAYSICICAPPPLQRNRGWRVGEQDWVPRKHYCKCRLEEVEG